MILFNFIKNQTRRSIGFARVTVDDCMCSSQWRILFVLVMNSVFYQYNMSLSSPWLLLVFTGKITIANYREWVWLKWYCFSLSLWWWKHICIRKKKQEHKKNSSYWLVRMQLHCRKRERERENKIRRPASSVFLLAFFLESLSGYQQSNIAMSVYFFFFLRFILSREKKNMIFGDNFIYILGEYIGWICH